MTIVKVSEELRCNCGSNCRWKVRHLLLAIILSRRVWSGLSSCLDFFSRFLLWCSHCCKLGLEKFSSCWTCWSPVIDHSQRVGLIKG